MRCLTSSRFNLTALLLVPGEAEVEEGVEAPGTPTGRYEYRQDDDTGALIRVWVPDVDDIPENPTAVEGGLMPGRRFRCIARAVTDGGIRVAGTTERYSSRGTIDTVDFIKIQFPKNIVLTRRDRITDIRNRKNELLWREEEFDDSATIFEVNGVSPIIDPFGNHVENFALLQRAENQQG